MIIFKKLIKNSHLKFLNNCFKKTFIFVRSLIANKNLLIILLVLIMFTQVSCGLFYVENVKKLNSLQPSAGNINQQGTSDTGQDFSSNSGSPGSGTGEQTAASKGNTSANVYENVNFADPAFTVTRVIDGDTIDLKNKMRLRLIGINTPEKDMYFFEEAKVFMEMLVLGKQVKLEKDITNNDMYGRYLRYVYLPDMFVNLEMVKSGFANSYTYPPDVKYTDKFLEAERIARENEAGLWEKASSEVLEVVLNYDAEGPDTKNLNGEWASMKNTGSKPLNLKNWTIKDAGTNIYKFGKYLLEPGSTVFLFTGSGTDSAGKLYWNSSMPIWNNDHDTLYIRNDEGLLVYLFNY
jgi:micrococcal nuclease